MHTGQTIDDLLRQRFGLSELRPGQREAIESLLSQRAALAVFPTGGGKSLCYQLPALLFEGVTVVVSPLIALMKDQIDFLRGRGVDAARLDSSLTLEESASVSARLRSGELRLLYVAPERFNNERFLNQLRHARIALFAIDEAHCISEWGHNFRPDYLKLASFAVELGAERVLALTATATPPVVEDICASFRIPAECAIVTGFHRPNLRLLTSPTAAGERDAALLERLSRRQPGSGIVYVTLQRTAEQVAEQLAAAGIPARPYHAGLDDETRTEVQEWWKGSDRATVVATIAFGMGIDKPDVRYVYHYNLPKSLESYSQEIGRAGRDGLPSVVETLGSLEDSVTLENFAYGDTPTPESLRSFLEEILAGPAKFDVSLYSLASRHDIRQLVLRTALTYLELAGVLVQGTPFYAGYRVRPHTDVEAVVAPFDAGRRAFLTKLFAAAKQGRLWYTVDPAAVADQIGEDRERVVAALGYLADRGLVELRPSDARQRYTRISEDRGIDELVAELEARFTRREQQEIQRLEAVQRLITLDSCQTNALLVYFGEDRNEPCGHCSLCESGTAVSFPELPERRPIDSVVARSAIDELAQEYPDALNHPRQHTQLLYRLTSPALTRSRLSGNPIFGVLERYPFPDVLRWCAG